MIKKHLLKKYWFEIKEFAKKMAKKIYIIFVRYKNLENCDKWEHFKESKKIIKFLKN